MLYGCYQFCRVMILTNSPAPILYADDGYLCHQVRLVLLEKHIEFGEVDIRDSDVGFEDLADINPYNTLPVLVHRELVLYQNTVIFEYLEERYHQYKLLPEAPAERARYRQLLWRINQDWLHLADILLTHVDTLDMRQAQQARTKLSESLVTLAPLFAHQPFFLSDKFGLCDCILASMLYRLEAMAVVLPTHLTRPLQQYMQRVFSRPTFQASLTPHGLTA